MQPYLDEMLGLTADIAEELLYLKDTGEKVSEPLADKISRLAALALKDLARPVAPVQNDANGECMEAEISAELLNADGRDDCMQDVPGSFENETSPVAAGKPMNSEVSYEDVNRELMPEMVAEEVEEEVEHDAGDAETVVEPSSGESLPPEPSFNNGSMALKRMFSLNDVFLYRRLLFKGSQQDFNDVLEIVPLLSSADELRQLLSDRYGVDLKSEEAKDFMSIVLPYIKVD